MTGLESVEPTDDGVLIRIKAVGRFFGPRVDLHTTDAVVAWHIFLRILGFDPKPRYRDNVQRTVPIAGQVLDDINLEIERGAVVCLEGASGAGKSVLLRLVAGTLQPTEGRIELSGRVSSLLQPGANLDDRLTARENVDMQRRLKGLDAEELESYLAQVMEFSQLEGFEDLPVRTYSTGMRMRLSLGIALLGNPDILIVDDVLAVGDISFQQRCVERLLALRDQGTTMLLAFGDRDLVRRLATRIVRLRGGRIVDDGPPGGDALTHHSGGDRDITWEIDEILPANELVEVTRVNLTERRDAQRMLILEFEVAATSAGTTFHPAIILMKEKAPLLRSAFPRPIDVTSPNRYRFTVEFGADLLHEGRYELTIAIRLDSAEMVHGIKAHGVVKFEVGQHQGTSVRGGPISAVQLPWEIARVETMDQAA